jgi:glycine/D-amino acid oxidase-like deaminating enzyme
MHLEPVPWPPLGPSPWAPPSPPAFVALPRHVDVVIAGAGVTGLSAALHLADAGRHVVVIDRAFGQGAACRSGGIILGDTLAGPDQDFDDCAEDLRLWLAAHGIRGGLEWGGCLELDRDGRRPPRPLDWRDAGVVRAGERVAGGTLDPAALVEALAREAAARGVRFVDGVAVSSAAATRSSVEVRTSAGAITGAALLIATDATSRVPDADPWPVRALTVVVETTRAPEDALERAGWPHGAFYTNDLPLLWGRRLPCGGLLVGRELIAIDPQDDARVKRQVYDAGLRLAARLRGLHAALVDLGVARVWAGPIARTERGIPTIGPDPDHPRAIYAGGYGGHGLAQAFRAGRMAAARIPR